MSLLRALLKMPRLITSFVLLASALGWASHASLNREVWVGFEGNEMAFRDRLTFQVDIPQRWTLVEPFRLEAASGWQDWERDGSEGQWIQLFKTNSGEASLPVAGAGDVQILSSVAAPLWRSIPVSPTGSSFDTAILDVHLGPGWSLVGVTGGGRVVGSWASRWSWQPLLLLAALVGLVGWGVSPRLGLCALFAGLAIGGTGHIWLGAFAVLGLLVAIAIRLPENDWRSNTLFELAILPAAVLGIWLPFHSLWEISQVIQPQSAVVWKDSPPGQGTELLHDGWFRRAEAECGAKSSRLRVEASAGDQGWSREVPTVFGIGSAWLPSQDSADFQVAPTGRGVPYWDFTMGRVEWFPGDRGGTRAAVQAGDRMRILAAPPWLTTVSRILGLGALWALWIGLCLRHDRFRRMWVNLSSLAPRLAVFLVLCAPAVSMASKTDSVQGEILRSFSYDGRWHLSTTIVQVYGSRKVFRIPLAEGETPVDSLRIQDGEVLVTGGKGKFPLTQPGDWPVDDGLIGEDVDVSELNLIDEILGNGGGRKSPPPPSVAIRRVEPPKPDSVETESYRSGDWVAPTAWVKLPPSRRSLMPTGTSLTISAPSSSRWLETWSIHCPPRFQPIFHGMLPGGEADSRSAFVFHPKPGDSLRVDVRGLEPVPVEPFQITHATLRYADADFSGARLWMNLRVSVGDTLRIWLPPQASEVVVWVDCLPVAATGNAEGRWDVPISGSKGWTSVALTWKEPPQDGVFRRAGPVRVSAPGANLFVEVPDPTGKWVLGMGGRGFGPRVVWWLIPLLAGAAVWRLSRSRRLPGGRLAWTVVLGAWPSLLVSCDMLGHLFPYGETMELAYGVNRIAEGAFDSVLDLYQVLAPMDLKWYLDRFQGSLTRPWMIVVPNIVCFLCCVLWIAAFRKIRGAARKAAKIS